MTALAAVLAVFVFVALCGSIRSAILTTTAIITAVLVGYLAATIWLANHPEITNSAETLATVPVAEQGELDR